MPYQIHWLLFLKATTREKAQRLLDAFARAIAQDIAEVECEPYWKDKSLFRVTCSCSIHSTEPAAAVLETLQVSGRVARRWAVGAPQFYEGDRWEFCGGAMVASITVSGVTYIDFQVGNLDG